jgi:hypothetical protein
MMSTSGLRLMLTALALFREPEIQCVRSGNETGSERNQERLGNHRGIGPAEHNQAKHAAGEEDKAGDATMLFTVRRDQRGRAKERRRSVEDGLESLGRTNQGRETSERQQHRARDAMQKAQNRKQHRVSIAAAQS